MMLSKSINCHLMTIQVLNFLPSPVREFDDINYQLIKASLFVFHKTIIMLYWNLQKVLIYSIFSPNRLKEGLGPISSIESVCQCKEDQRCWSDRDNISAAGVRILHAFLHKSDWKIMQSCLRKGFGQVSKGARQQTYHWMGHSKIGDK